MGDEWTEPDTSEEQWMQPWEEEPPGWMEPCDYGPEFWMAFEEAFGVFDGDGEWSTTDFYAPRARWVSDR